MSCCGSRRAAQRRDAAPEGRNPAAAYSTGPVEFEYSGSGRLEVVGPMTGTRYSFSGGGSRTVVHAADVPSLVMVPSLRAVR